MAINKVDIVGINTQTLRTFSAEESNEMLVKIKAGDMDAREKFIMGNLRLVLSVIQRFSNRNEQINDLFQVGCIGLTKAIDNFDMSHNVRFSTYAVPMIIGEVRRHLRDSGAMRVSRSLRDTAYKALQMRAKLTNETGNDPTIGDIAAAMNLSEYDVVYALDAISDPISLFEPIYHDDGDAIYVMDQIKDETKETDKFIEKLALENSIDNLPERERKIINMRFFQDKTQMEVAKEIGISQAQVSRLEKNALTQMRKFLT